MLRSAVEQRASIAYLILRTYLNPIWAQRDFSLALSILLNRGGFKDWSVLLDWIFS